VEIARHWRLQRQRYCLEGIKKTDTDGNEQISVSGSSWVDIPSNGRSKEKPLMESVVYEAPSLEGKNGGTFSFSGIGYAKLDVYKNGASFVEF